MADPDEALIEAIEAAIDNATDATFCPHDGLEHVCHCNTCAAHAAYAAMVEHLGLVEETETRDLPTPDWPGYRSVRYRRLVQSQWVEVDHGSE